MFDLIREMYPSGLGIWGLKGFPYGIEKATESESAALPIATEFANARV